MTDANLTLRSATEADVPEILGLIRDLATYEKLAHEVVSTEEALHRTLFGERRYAEVVMADAPEERAAGFALFFHNYSTFLARPGIYLEDLYVKPQFRGRGYGKTILRHLAKLALERQCGRVEWAVLKWNEPAIRFYESIGATAVDEWSIFRLTGTAIDTLATS